MLSKKNSMVTMVTDEFLENRIILQKSVATIGFIWFFWFQKCILLYIFVQVFLVMRCIRSHISLFRLGLTPTLIRSWLFILTERIQFFLQQMRKLVRYVLPLSNKSSSKLHNFSCFTSKNGYENKQIHFCSLRLSCAWPNAQYSTMRFDA